VALSFWLGGQLFLVLVVRPVLARSLPERSQRTALTADLGRQFSPLAWASLGILVVTGWLLGTHRHVQWTALLATGSDYARILATKIVLVGIVLALTLVHGRSIGPRFAALARSGHASDRARTQHLARWSRVVSGLNLLLTFLIVFLAARLVP
jgi:uncharacterized membrane protein